MARVEMRSLAMGKKYRVKGAKAMVMCLSITRTRDVCGDYIYTVDGQEYYDNGQNTSFNGHDIVEIS